MLCCRICYISMALKLALQLLILAPYFVKASQFEQSAKDVVLRVLDMLVHAAPPAIPAVMLLCGFSSLIRLRKQYINLIFREELNLAAGVDTVCFDKTSTLTGSVVSQSLSMRG